MRLSMVFAGLLFAELLDGAVSAAFSNVDIGDHIGNATLPTLRSGDCPFLGDSRANVFVFFRPSHTRSEEVLRDLQHLKDQLSDRPVHWSAIVSGSHDRLTVQRLVQKVGLEMSVLIDTDDQLYARLGVMLHPVVGIADADHRLKAYVHYRKIHLASSVEAHILHVLGEIDTNDLDQRLSPKPVVIGGDKARARRNWQMAKMLIGMQQYEPALEAARKSARLDPEFAEAHALIGKTLAERGDCAAARNALDQALKLAPQNAAALEGAKLCPAPGPPISEAGL